MMNNSERKRLLKSPANHTFAPVTGIAKALPFANSGNLHKSGKSTMAEGRDANGRWLPGTPGSTVGRPKGRSLWIKADLERLLNELTTIGPEGATEIVTRKEAILRKAIEQAEEGDARAREWIADRTDGKVREVPVEQEEQRDPIKLLDIEEAVTVTQDTGSDG